MVRIHLHKKNYPLIDLKKLLIITSAILIIEAFSFLLPFQNNIIKTLILRTLDIFIIYLFILKFKMKNLFLDKKIFFCGVKTGLIISFAAGLIFFFISFIIKKIFNISIINFLMNKPPSAKELCILILSGGIISPIAEELYFRGIFLSFLKEKLNIFAAIFFSSLIFAIIHNSSPAASVFQFAGGLFFASAYILSKNIYVPIIIHSAGNIFIFILPEIKNLYILSSIIQLI
ncbi:MAG: hypothetical protein CSB21_02400 [Deltaproteobacteria bacterium]|nr:MAG: hypothetical protein CSB21_02400 [Deltaproteobacteria bacterium]